VYVLGPCRRCPRHLQVLSLPANLTPSFVVLFHFFALWMSGPGSPQAQQWPTARHTDNAQYTGGGP
jgi:hypothetical protein